MSIASPPMSDSSSQNPYASSSENSGVYRTVNRAALVSVVLAALGVTAFLFPVLIVLPLAAVFLGLSGYKAIQRFPDEFSGLKLAEFGMGAGGAILIGAMITHTVIYVTEVPEGFQRVIFNELQPESLSQKGRIPKRAMELSGKPIFIKGYMHPCVDGMGKVDEFVLVPDMGTCCFGGQPKMTDMILVKSDQNSRLAYCRRQVKLAGTFHVGKRPQAFSELNNVVYRLDASYAK